MTDFFICSIKSPQCTDNQSKNYSIAIFRPRVLMYQKFHFRWGTNRQTKNRRLGKIVTSFQDFKGHSQPLDRADLDTSFLTLKRVHPNLLNLCRVLLDFQSFTEKPVFQCAFAHPIMFYHIWLKTVLIVSLLYANQLWYLTRICVCAPADCVPLKFRGKQISKSFSSIVS